MELHKGTVEFFSEDRGFGFVNLEDGKVFLHIKHAYRLVRGQDEPEFLLTGLYGDNLPGLVYPKGGDELVFELVFDREQPVDRRWRTGAWSTQTEYDYLQKLIDENKAYEAAIAAKIAALPRYRLYRIKTVKFEKLDHELLWEGVNLEALQYEFPIPDRGEDPKSDPIRRLILQGAGNQTQHCWMVKRSGEEEWQQCPDPRKVKRRTDIELADRIREQLPIGFGDLVRGIARPKFRSSTVTTEQFMNRARALMSVV